MQQKEMILIPKWIANVKPPKVSYKKPPEGDIEPVQVATITFELPIAGLDEHLDAMKTLAMYAHQGHPILLTVTAMQGSF